MFRGCSRTICKKKSINIKDTLYKVGIKKLHKEFDMVRYLKKIRIADSLAALTLSEF